MKTVPFKTVPSEFSGSADWEGIIVVNKSSGITSNRVIQCLRKITKVQKMGFLGTLDPIATGVLPLCLGWATKIIPFIPDRPKGYRAVMVLGGTTDTQDATGQLIKTARNNLPNRKQVEEILKEFLGLQEQIPPSYSALKYKGKPLYHWARKGIKIVKPPRRISIDSIELLGMEEDRVSLEIFCSPGTYIRTLGHDMGERLGCGAYLKELERIQSGPFTISQAVSLDEIQSVSKPGEINALKIPVEKILDHLPQVWVEGQWKEKIKQGRFLKEGPGISPWPQVEPGIPVCVKGPKDELWAIYQKEGHNKPTLKPIRVII